MRARGFTLVEVLVGFTVVGVLVGLTFFALRGFTSSTSLQRVRWQLNNYHYNWLEAEGNTLFALTTDSHLIALDPTSGHEKWSIQENSFIEYQFAVDSSRVYYVMRSAKQSDGSYQRSLVARNTETGEVLWRQIVPAYSEGIVSDGTVVYLTFREQRKLAAYSTQTGQLLWQGDLNIPVLGTYPTRPIPVSGAVAIGTPDGSVTLFDSHSGQTRWSKPSVGDTDSYHLVAADDHAIYMTEQKSYQSSDIYLMALDPKTGNQLWDVTVPEGNPGGYAAFSASNLAFGRSYGRSVMLLSSLSGHALGSVSVSQLSNILATTDQFYLVSNTGGDMQRFSVQVDAIDSHSGRENWSYHLDDVNFSEPTIWHNDLFVVSRGVSDSSDGGALVDLSGASN